MSRDDEHLDFERADFSSPKAGGRPIATPGALACGQCGRTIGDAYYTFTGAIACADCATQLRSAGPPGSALSRGLGAFGLGLLAAVLASAVWMVITRVTGYEIGLIAIGVGWIVGLAVMAGGRSVGGWPYQLLAVALTYTAIVMTDVPHLLPQIEAQYREASAAAEAERAAEPEAGDPLVALERERDASEAEAVTVRALAWTTAILLAFVLPFLGGLENAIGLLIIGFGLYQAFVMTKRRDLRWAGPFAVGRADVA